MPVGGNSKVMTAREAVGRFVRDGDSVMVGGFPHVIPMALVHEVIRQGRRDLTLIKEAMEQSGDQLVAAGCARKAIFGFAGIPNMGACSSVRQALEGRRALELEIEEHSHYSFSAAITARAMGVPFMPIRGLIASDLGKVNPRIKYMDCPFSGERVCLVGALEGDVALLHAQRADEEGNVQVWGLTGLDNEIALACRRVIVSVEELVSNEDIRHDPNRTLVPGFKVDAVVVEPFGAHPSFVQGYYDRDDEAYLEYAEQSKTEEGFRRYAEKWIHGVEDRRGYLRKLGTDRLLELRSAFYASSGVNYGY